MINPAKARALLELHEGCRLKPYTDTVGKLTIGYGHNLTDRGISQDAANFIFEEDLRDCDLDCSAKLPVFESLDPVRQLVLIDIAFNAGIAGLLKFQKMLAALEAGDYSKAGDEIDNSQLARGRAARLAMMMKSGEYPKEILEDK